MNLNDFLKLIRKDFSLTVIDDINDLFNDFINNYENELKKEINHIFGRGTSTLPTDLKNDLNSLFSNSTDEYATMAHKINNNVVRIVKNGFDKDLLLKDIRNDVVNEIGRFRNYAETITRTANQAFNQVKTVSETKKEQRFKFVGAPPERPFCVKMMELAKQGKTYTKNEIQSMNNGQGLPVLYYCGGWNCRHWWMPV